MSLSIYIPDKEKGEVITCDPFPSTMGGMANLKSKPRVIAFCGPLGSGKTTAANMLVDVISDSWSLLSLATPLKQAADILCPLTQGRSIGSTEQKDQVLPDCNKTSRDILIELGSAVKSILGEAVFARELLLKISQKAETHCSHAWVIVDDLRMKEEHDFLCEHSDLLVINMSRPGTGESRYASHKTEQGWKSFKHDYSIKNDKEIWAMKQEVERFARKEGLYEKE